MISILQHNPHANAFAQSETDVLLHAIPELSASEELLPGHSFQQEQHGTARQVVQQFPVSFDLLPENPSSTILW